MYNYVLISLNHSAVGITDAVIQNPDNRFFVSKSIGKTLRDRELVRIANCDNCFEVYADYKGKVSILAFDGVNYIADLNCSCYVLKSVTVVSGYSNNKEYIITENPNAPVTIIARND